MDLETRVDKLEQKVEDLNVIPVKLDSLIELQQESNRNIANMGKTYVTKEVVELIVKNMVSDLKLWTIVSFVTGVASLMSLISVLWHMKVGG